MVPRWASSYGRELVQRTSWLWPRGGIRSGSRRLSSSAPPSGGRTITGDIALPRTRPSRGRVIATGRGRLWDPRRTDTPARARGRRTGAAWPGTTAVPSLLGTADAQQAALRDGDRAPSACSGRDRRPARRARRPRSRPTGPLVAAPGCRRADRADTRGCHPVHDPGDQQSSGGGCSSHDPRIGGTCEVLVDDGVDIVSGGDEYVAGRARHVLVELDLHSPPSGTSSSRASSAP